MCFYSDHISATDITRFYKYRWQVELFFKWIKQHLRIKAFFGTSENAVKTQIWIAVSDYVLVAIINTRRHEGLSRGRLCQFAKCLICGDHSASALEQATCGARAHDLARASRTRATWWPKWVALWLTGGDAHHSHLGAMLGIVVKPTPRNRNLRAAIAGVKQ